MEKWTRANYTPVLPLGKDGRRITAGPEHIEISKNAARDGMVLLKNKDDVLPLPNGSRVALFGKATFDYVKGGGGSGDVTVPYVRNLYEGLKMLGDAVRIYPLTADFYRKYVEKQYALGRQPGLMKEPELPDKLLWKAAAAADTAIISISRFSSEGWDRKSAFDRIPQHRGVEMEAGGIVDQVFPKGDFYLTDEEERLVTRVAAEFSRVVIVLNVGGMIETVRFAGDDRISSVLLAWQGGMEGGLAAAELLTGKVSPSGKLSDTFAETLEDYPGSENFYESDDYAEYSEDIYVGYRYFETIPGAADKVVYPFGFGLSYTTFALTNTDADEDEGEITVTADVTNTGERPGREVVQVYFSAPQGMLGKPARELIGYKKTKMLAPGKKQRIRISFRVDDMASYDDLGKAAKSAYVMEEGAYRIYVGTNVRDARELDFVHFEENTRVVKQLSAKMVPNQLKKRLLSDGSYENLPAGQAPDADASVLGHLPTEVWDMRIPVPRAAKPISIAEFAARQEQYHFLKDVADGKCTIEEFLAQLSDEDLAHLLGGQPNTGVANTFGYGNQPLFGIPNIMTADGPAGLRVRPETGVTTTAFPCSTLLACTWDPEVCEAVGKAAGEEFVENNIGVWLAPGVCIHRNPLCGRNFEYYSEDPYLTAKQASGLVRGVQSQHIGATIKHFALNNKETNRRNSDSRASERAIREIYLKAFRLIIEEADPWSVMTSYNLINGCRASENKELLTDILRGEWGYEGLVVSDWWNNGEHYKECAAGNDVKMGAGYPERLLAAMEKGALTRADMEKAAAHLLGLILKAD